MTKLSDVSRIVDCEHKTSPIDEQAPYGYAVGTPALKRGRIDVLYARPVSRETYAEWTRRLVPQKGDIILSREAPVGRLGFVDGSNRVCLGQRTVLIRASEESVLPKYLFHLIRGRYIQEWMTRRSMGSTVHHLNVSDIKQMPVGRLPSIETQREIVNLLEPIEKVIALCLETVKRQNELGDLLFHTWFHQFDFPDHFGKPYRASGGQLKPTSTLGLEIPVEWTLERLEDHLEFQRGFDPGSELYKNSLDHPNLVPFLRVGDLEERSEIFVDRNTKGLIICQPEELLVTFDGSVGKVATGLYGAISGGFRIIKPKSKVVSPSVAYFIMRSERVQSIIQKFSTGTVLKHASGSIKKLVLPYSKTELEAFSHVVSPLFLAIQNLNLTRITLESALVETTAKLVRF